MLVGPGMLDEGSRLILTNAIYFLGKWEHEFNVQRTAQAPFFVSSQQSIAMPMMKQTNSFYYGEFDDLQVLEMPYRSHAVEWRIENDCDDRFMTAVEIPGGGSDFSMCILLPRPHVRLADLETRLSTHVLQQWLTLQACDVQVTIPRFRKELGLEMTDRLKHLGITRAFSQAEADFSRITTDPAGLFIASVVHKAFIEVNEKGTEAAAATAIMLFGGRAVEPEPPKEFRADRPFLFLIRDRQTKLIHFLGRVTCPTPLTEN